MENSNFCYLAEVNWDNDGRIMAHNCIIYANTYANAMKTILNYYSEEDIVDVKLTYFVDTLFRIPSDKINELKDFQEHVYD